MRYDTDRLHAMGINSAYIDIRFNGEKAPRWCIAFDPDEGYIEVYRIDAEGRAVVENESFVVDTLHGQVEAWLLWQLRLKMEFAPEVREQCWPHAVPKPPDDVRRVNLRSVRV